MTQKLLNINMLQFSMLSCYICDATETGGMPPVTTTNETMPLPWRWQAALVWSEITFLLPISWWQCMGSKLALSKIKHMK